MPCRVQPGSLRGGRRQLGSAGHAWLPVALGRELPPWPRCGHQRPCESGRATASTSGAAATAVSVFRTAHFSTRYSPLTLFQARASRSCAIGARPLPGSARPAWDCVSLLLPEWHPPGPWSCFCCLSSFIFAPSHSPVLCSQGSPAPPEQLGARGY